MVLAILTFALLEEPIARPGVLRQIELSGLWSLSNKFSASSLVFGKLIDIDLDIYMRIKDREEPQAKETWGFDYANFTNACAENFLRTSATFAP